MKKTYLSLIAMILSMTCAVPAYAGYNPASGVPATTPAPDSVTNFAILGFVVVAGLGIYLTIYFLTNSDLTNTKNADTDGKWQLAQALSEEVDITIDATTKKTVFVASSSRLIAFVAMIVLLSLLCGIAPIIIWHYAQSGDMPNLDKLSAFLAACATPFLPYMANQARAAVENKTPPQTPATPATPTTPTTPPH